MAKRKRRISNFTLEQPTKYRLKSFFGDSVEETEDAGTSISLNCAAQMNQRKHIIP